MHNPVGKSAVTLTTMGGLVTYAGPDSLPSGVSPRCHDVTFDVGSVKSRKGTHSVLTLAAQSSQELGGVAMNFTITGNAWNSPANAITTEFAYASSVAAGETDGLDVTQFGFNIPTASSIAGIQVDTNAFSSSATLTAQLLVDGDVVGTAIVDNLPSSAGNVTFGGSAILWGFTPVASTMNRITFGVRFIANGTGAIVNVNNVRITIFQGAPQANFDWVKSFIASNGTILNLSMDANGEMWQENASSTPGTVVPILGGLPINGYAKSVTADDREYICFSDLRTGNDIPRLYTGDWFDRITQVGPAAPPIVSPSQNTGDTYALVSITQPSAQSRTSSYFLQSSGPGVLTAGNTVTVYYSDSTLAGPDTDLVNAFNSGNPVFLYFSFTGAPVVQGPYVVQVTSVNEGSPPGQPRPFYYFTFNLLTSAATYYAGSGHPSYTANYQRTLATLDTAVPVPGLIVNSRIAVSGNSVAAWNSNWTITQALNSGSMVITQTALSAAGVGTYSYSVVSGANPVAGELVTVTSTLNANGFLNVTNTPIAAATGGSTGTFTVNGLPAGTDYPNVTESGQATTAGTEFAFDPGAADAGTATNPIFGNGTGGQITFQGSLQFLSPGTRQAVVFFITRNGTWTFPSNPTIFTVPENTSALNLSLIPLGPPNVVARGISITEAGQLGVPGANFYTLPDPVNYTVNGTTYTSDSFIIPDNVTTSISLTFRDVDLLAAEAIDIPGNDLFNLIEIGSPAWVVAYADRLIYGLAQAKVQNFVNLSFDGGYLPGGKLIPLGWTTPDAYGELLISPIFGNSYYIKNTTGATLGTAGTITQSAYRDYYQVPIVRPDVTYSVRVNARIPSGNTDGDLLIVLRTNGISLWASQFSFSSLSTAFSTVTLPLVLTAFNPVPPDLELVVQAANMGAGADVEIDRIEFFPTRQPVMETTLLASYIDEPEEIDGNTGQISTAGENTQPCYGAVVMYDLLYLLKDKSMYYTQDSSGNEPNQWGVHEVSNKAGACGVNAYDSGEEWILMANRNGIYLFTGGEPKKILQEIQQVWDAINWSAGQSIWVRNDVASRKFKIGIPLPTPNFWLPNAPTNAAPSYPNVILECSYEGQDTGTEVAGASPVFATQFGNLDSTDLRRKWSIFQIPCPYADFITRPNGEDAPLWLGNGIHNSKIYDLSSTNDDGVEIPWRYITYGFGNDTDSKNFPALGSGRKRWSYLLATIMGAGNALMKFYSNRIDGTVQYSVPGGVTLSPDDADRERPLNIPGNRVYVEVASGGIDSVLDFSQLTMIGTKDVFNSIRGVE